ncbi:HNH endonuclease [Nocardioides sp. JS614]|nr:HNH endonuclease [Nocardioides sp. JS614]
MEQGVLGLGLSVAPDLVEAMKAPVANTPRTGSVDRVLGAARAVRADLTAAEARRFEIAADCAALHPGEEVDHIIPWPLGPTATSNLAPICRLHHRLKTTGGWTYHRHTRSTFEWTSPHHRTYVVTSSRHIH